MNLTLEQIRSAARGVARVEERDGQIAFFRFTEAQSLFYQQRDPDFFRKSKSTSGVVLEFDTDSENLSLEAEVSSGSSRRFIAHTVLVNGVPRAHLGDVLPPDRETGVLSGSISLGAGQKRVKILFPWAVCSRLRFLRLDDGSHFSPVQKDKTLILFGDSITQGYDSALPEHSYAAQLTAWLDWNGINKAIGGEIFCPELAALPDAAAPDLITVAYGTNDWSKCAGEALFHNSREFYRNLRRTYPDTRILALSPIWRADMDRENKACPFREVAAHLREVAREIGNADFIDCYGFVPQNTGLFSDAYLHPNEEGFRHYARGLIGQLSRLELK